MSTCENDIAPLVANDFGAKISCSITRDGSGKLVEPDESPDPKGPEVS